MCNEREPAKGNYVFIPSLTPEMKALLVERGLVFLEGEEIKIFSKITGYGHGIVTKQIAEV